jgi:hypothetical protein
LPPRRAAICARRSTRGGCRARATGAGRNEAARVRRATAVVSAIDVRWSSARARGIFGPFGSVVLPRRRGGDERFSQLPRRGEPDALDASRGDGGQRHVLVLLDVRVKAAAGQVARPREDDQFPGAGDEVELGVKGRRPVEHEPHLRACVGQCLDAAGSVMANPRPITTRVLGGRPRPSRRSVPVARVNATATSNRDAPRNCWRSRSNRLVW